jgi:hypothetical protein
MKVSLSRFRIRPDKVGRADQWISRLRQCRDRCVETLARERMKFEVIFRELIDGREHLYGLEVQEESGDEILMRLDLRA